MRRRFKKSNHIPFELRAAISPIKQMLSALGVLNYRLWCAVLVTMIIPTIYQTVRIYFLGNMPDDSSVNIASQLQWVSLVYEVIQEALILPLFFLFGASLDDRLELENRVKTGFFITAAIYLVVSAVMLIFTPQLVRAMAQTEALVSDTVVYVRLETAAAVFSTLTRYVTLVLITLNKDSYMYTILLTQMVCSILLDIFLISDLSCSAQIGVNGIAIANIVVNFLMLVIGIVLLTRQQIKLWSPGLSFKWLRDWFKVGAWSGLESLSRNLAFSIMVVRMTNVVSAQGNYWVANNFIWNWLLLPTLALADVIKKEVGESASNISRKTFGYFLLTCIFAALWLISIPSWKPFLRKAMNTGDATDTVYHIALIQTGFFMTYLFNSICDSTFYGLGKTWYMMIQSICIDIVYYGIAFGLYKAGIFVPTLTRISLMFGIGMALDFIPTLILYVYMLKKNHITIQLHPRSDAKENKIEQLSVQESLKVV
eukprot:Blabericola_migrator_1__11403@NODE_676_length_6914_cov_416_476705_g490_i0_p2_GENE_NODE_676_length_6914_cov_416_476705_g490_i0NODE_676_length_6914_cov_416_476705_g490_i0_p2_ORF_typecomplete_len483_score70_58MurJ/PF03023_14/1_2e05MurJ/PF03023_14/0_0022MatE/PF01554_18/7_2e06MatE/PF01554_18/5_4e02MatE/PF01554_18/0_0014MatE/PF01554_18/8_1e03Polysacc_synt_3/PF13440_6/0_19Polysacc_synt_3/PF13440_6/5_5e07Polysacc_synt_3/PF13440_6/6_3Polysacc_synt_C/PF14667_6/3e03Polysacc_synt_C/PF14667_6/6_7e02Polysacc_